jgi:uncharacterized protein (DUF2062 family)
VVDTLKTMNRWLTNANAQLVAWLRMGISPERLALTLALGFAIGCLPLVGVPTALCAVIAVRFGLNIPVIQAANYIAMPFQLALILPLSRFGGWMLSAGHRPALASTLSHGPLQAIWMSGTVASHALAAWLVIAGPMVLLLTLTLTPILERVPALASERAE